LKNVTNLARNEDFDCEEKFSECWILQNWKLHENLLNKICFIS
jgi:hypothetical protein